MNDAANETIPAADERAVAVRETGSPVDLDARTRGIDPTIFRAYDIRGIVGRNLTEDVVRVIGRAYAAEAVESGQSRVAVGYDGRHSSPNLTEALAQGFTAGGLDVIDTGQVPTPLLYFATHELATGAGVMITGSHNPSEYNGLKMMLGGKALAGDAIANLKARIDRGAFSQGAGSRSQAERHPPLHRPHTGGREDRQSSQGGGRLRQRRGRRRGAATPARTGL